MNLHGKIWPYFDELHDICKSSAAHGKAAHHGTTSLAGTAVPSFMTSTSSSTDLLVLHLTSSTLSMPLTEPPLNPQNVSTVFLPPAAPPDASATSLLSSAASLHCLSFANVGVMVVVEHRLCHHE